MANTSVSGLVSGLDTATIISQLMQIEAQPQTNLKNQVSVEQTVVTALQNINSKLAGIATKAADLAKLTNWSPLTATSDNAKVTVTTSTGAGPATLKLTVGNPATPSSLDFGSQALTTKITSDGSTVVMLTKPDGTTSEVDTKDGTVQGLANALNGGNYGATATLVQETSGSYHLVLTAAGTGSTSMSLTAKSGAPMAISGTAATGQQAKITVNGVDIYSNTNTFKSLMPEVDVTLASDASGSATITVARDAKSVSDSVKALVDAVNSVLSDMDTQTAYDPTTKKSGPLAGEPLLRDLRQKLVDAVTHGVNGQSLSSVGVQVDRYGKLVFDATKFESAYATDPDKTASMFTDATTTTDPSTGLPKTVGPGLASVLAGITKTASDSLDGSVTLAIKGHNSSIKDMNDSIADWDVRLTAKQQALQLQYANLEVALGKLQDQASWLSGQIASLPKMG